MASTTASTSHLISNRYYGADGDGVDCRFYGDTASAYMQWDASANHLIFAGVGGIKIGTLSSTTAGSGLTVSSDRKTIIEVHADDNNTAIASANTVRCIDGRMMNYNSPQAETWGIQGKCKVSELAMTANVKAGVVGAFESTGTCSTATGSGNTFIAGVMGRLGLAANMTLGAGTFACGVLSFYNTASASDPTGEYTCAFMATASDIAGTGDWDYGVYIEDTMKAWYSTTSLSGSSAVNNMELAVTDATTASSGYTRGLYVNATVSGTKTGSGEHNSIGVDQTISGNTPYVYGYTYWSADSGDPTLGFVAPFSVYQDDLGTALGAWVGFDMGYAITNAPSGRFACMRFRNHTASARPTSVFLFESGNNDYTSTYLFDFATNQVGPIVADTSNLPSAATYKIKCRYGSTDFYLIGVADF